MIHITKEFYGKQLKENNTGFQCCFSILQLWRINQTMVGSSTNILDVLTNLWKTIHGELFYFYVFHSRSDYGNCFGV